MENTKCGVGDRENPRHSLSPGDGKDRGTGLWCSENPQDSRIPCIGIQEMGKTETRVWCRGQ